MRGRDIFAFGAILYQMVTGRPAFKEQTLALLIAAVQTVDPEPASKAQPMVPAALDHVIRRCLHKDPRQRLQTAWDLLAQLAVDRGRRIAGWRLGPLLVGAPRQRQDRAVWAALAVASLVAVGLTPPPSPRSAPRRNREMVRFTVSNMGAVRAVPISISPNGRWITAAKGRAEPRRRRSAAESGRAAGALEDSSSPNRSGRRTAVSSHFFRMGS